MNAIKGLLPGTDKNTLKQVAKKRSYQNKKFFVYFENFLPLCAGRQYVQRTFVSNLSVGTVASKEGFELSPPRRRRRRRCRCRRLCSKVVPKRVHERAFELTNYEAEKEREKWARWNKRERQIGTKRNRGRKRLIQSQRGRHRDTYIMCE